MTPEDVYKRPLGFRKNKVSHQLEIFDVNEQTILTFSPELDEEMQLAYAKLLSQSSDLYRNCVSLLKQLGVYDFRDIKAFGNPIMEICQAANTLAKCEYRGLINDMGKAVKIN